MIGPILWWHVETIPYKDQIFAFSPVGIGRDPSGWILMGWEKYKTAKRTGRPVKEWENTLSKGGDSPPDVPEAVWAIVGKKLMHMKSKPWPGDD